MSQKALLYELDEKRFALSWNYCPMQRVMQVYLFRVVLVAIMSLGSFGFAEAQVSDQQLKLGQSLDKVYAYWRDAMVSRDYRAWHQVSATHRRVALQNRILSEKGQWPADIFNVPAAPPTLKGLKMLRARSKGMSAKSVYFGKVNFGAGEAPADNLLLLSFVYEGRGWKYDTAEFINLDNLKDVRAQIASGDLAYVDEQAFLPTGVKPPTPDEVAEAKYIAKVYSYCPGREVKVRVNRISKHRFQDNQQSEVIIGGARDGINEISYEIRDLPGYQGDDPITIRVYLMSQVDGIKHIKIYQYQTRQGEKPKAQDSAVFQVNGETAAKILGLR